MRGDWREANPWQLAMGQGARGHLEAAGVIVSRLDEPDEAFETVGAAAALAFETQSAAAVLVGQRLIGAKRFEN